MISALVRPKVRDYLREKGLDVSVHRRRTLTRTSSPR